MDATSHVTSCSAFCCETATVDLVLLLFDRLVPVVPVQICLFKLPKHFVKVLQLQHKVRLKGFKVMVPGASDRLNENEFLNR